MAPTDSTTSKVCKKCGESKPADRDNFGRDKYRSDGFNDRCRACIRSSGLGKPLGEAPDVPYPDVPGVEFRDIAGHPGYCVGDDGSVWSRRVRSRLKFVLFRDDWQPMKLVPYAPCGHLRVSLRGVGETTLASVHHLVLEAFVGPRPEGMEGCHAPDHDPANNHLNNLRWDTHEENMRDAIRQGRWARGETSGVSKLTEAEVIDIRRRYAAGETKRQLSESLGLNRSYVGKIVRRLNWADLPQPDAVPPAPKQQTLF